jgi:carbon storage regulator CsrA
MLVLRRRVQQGVILSGTGRTRIVVLGVDGDLVKLGFDAPRNAVAIWRDEAADKPAPQRKEK